MGDVPSHHETHVTTDPELPGSVSNISIIPHGDGVTIMRPSGQTVAASQQRSAVPSLLSLCAEAAMGAMTAGDMRRAGMPEVAWDRGTLCAPFIAYMISVPHI